MRPPIGPKKEETKAVYEAWMDMLIDWPEGSDGIDSFSNCLEPEEEVC